MDISKLVFAISRHFLSRHLAYTFPGWLRSDTPRPFVHSLQPPYLHIGMIMHVCQIFGIFSCSHATLHTLVKQHTSFPCNAFKSSSRFVFSRRLSSFLPSYGCCHFSESSPVQNQLYILCFLTNSWNPLDDKNLQECFFKNIFSVAAAGLILEISEVQTR